MRYCEIKASIEEAKKRKQKQEQERQDKDKGSLLGRIQEAMQNRQMQEIRKANREKARRTLVRVSAIGVAASISLMSALLIVSFYANRGRYFVPEGRNAGGGLVSQESPDFQSIDSFLKKLLADHEAQAVKKIDLDGKISKENADQIDKVLNALDSGDYKISYVQSDPRANCYYVMCDFSGKGCYYFTVEKHADDLRLVSVADFF